MGIGNDKSAYRKQSLTTTLTTLFLSPAPRQLQRPSSQTLLFTDSLPWRTDFFSPTSYPLNGLTPLFYHL
jgi:hypothetical protein